MTVDRFIASWLSFSIAARNLLSNEKSFQAWFAASLIQEFGFSRVYRELHIEKEQLRKPCKSFRQAFDTLNMHEGNEFIPDICIAREENVDTRHSATRDKGLRDIKNMLSKMSMITEFKVSASSKKATSFRSVRKDLLKLGLLGYAADCCFTPAMCIMEQSSRSNDSYLSRLEQELSTWPETWPRPHILLTRKQTTGWEVLHASGGIKLVGFRRIAEINQ